MSHSTGNSAASATPGKEASGNPLWGMGSGSGFQTVGAAEGNRKSPESQ